MYFLPHSIYLLLDLLNINCLNTFRYNDRTKRQEKVVLQQGLDLVTLSAVSAEPLLAPRTLLQAAPRHLGVEHDYSLPVNRAGEAVQWKKKSAKPVEVPIQPVTRSVVLEDVQQECIILDKIIVPAPVIAQSRTTAYCHKRKLEMGLEPARPAAAAADNRATATARNVDSRAADSLCTCLLSICRTNEGTVAGGNGQ